MEPCLLQEIIAACRGRLRQGRPEIRVDRVCTDSRQARPGDLFVALAGERFDGHDFAAAAARQGAAGLLVEAGRTEPVLAGCAVVEVENTRRALGDWAAQYRARFQLPVIAVAGSNGKTTTKELLAAVLRQGLDVLWNEASFNNDLGVPLTLLNLERHHQAVVCEVGTNHPGELAALIRKVQPGYGVFTGLGREHLEFFHDLAGVAAEEGWLAELLPADGVFFARGDSPLLESILERTRARVIRVGLESGNDWRARDWVLSWEGTAFEVEAPRGDWTGSYRMPLLGRHQVGNALLALAVAAQLGLDPEAARHGLATAVAPRHRLEQFEKDDVRILDDTYNANADSMGAALETLRDLPCRGRRLAVLGDMAELGPASDAAHAEIGMRAAELGVEILIAVGRQAPTYGDSARRAGVPRVFETDNLDEAVRLARQEARAGDTLLVKASREMQLERVVAGLRNGNGPAPARP